MGRVRYLVCVLTVLVVTAGPLWSGQIAAQTATPPADSDIDTTYRSPTYGYAIPYDDNDWQLVDDRSDDEIDTFVITNDISVVTFTGEPAIGDDADCLNAAGDALLTEAAFRDFDPAVTNGDEPYGGDGILGPYTGYTDGDTAVYLECGLSPDGNIEIVVRVIARLDAFGAEIGPINTIISGLTWKATSSSRYGGRGRQTTRATAVPTPTERPVNGNRRSDKEYLDTRNGWCLTWDEDWRLNSDPDEAGLLDLSNGQVDVYIYVILNITHAQDCLGDKLASLTSDEKVSNISALRRDGAPVRGGNADAAHVAYVYDYDADADANPLRMVDHYDCRMLPSGDDALMISLIVRENLYDDEAAILALLLEGLTIDRFVIYHLWSHDGSVLKAAWGSLYIVDRIG